MRLRPSLARRATDAAMHPWRSRVFIKPAASAERMLLNRLGLLATLVGAVLAVFWWDRDGLKDQIDGHISFSDVVYFTAVTVTTVGYGDIVPVSDRARTLDALFVTPARLVIWLLFLGTAYELVLQRWLENRRMARLQHSLHRHLVICGYGHTGRSAAHEARARGTPAGQILVLDRDESALHQAADDGFIGLQGDSTREQDLGDAGIQRAAAVLICLGRDDAAVLTVLTVRQLSSGVRVICSVGEQENVKLMRQAGSDAIVTPSIVAGHLMADSLQSTHIADYASDLMSAAGDVRLLERPARAEEIGRPLRELAPALGVRIYRDGVGIGFWEGEKARVQAGDLLLVIEPDGKKA